MYIADTLETHSHIECAYKGTVLLFVCARERQSLLEECVAFVALWHLHRHFPADVDVSIFMYNFALCNYQRQAGFKSPSKQDQVNVSILS